MVKANVRDIDRHLTKLDPGFSAVLVYGPDAGLAQGRFRALAMQVVEDLSDPFRVVRLSSEDLKEGAARISDELNALSMTGGRRLVTLEGASDGAASALDQVLEQARGDSLLLVSAGDLGPRSKLRKLFEGRKNGLAIPCYRAEGAALEEQLRRLSREVGLKVTQDAFCFLVEVLTSDYMVARRELEKLAIFQGENSEQALELDQVRQLVGDSGLLVVGDIAAAVTAGDLMRLERLLKRAQIQGEAPVAILRALIRRLQSLHLVRGLMDEGADFERAARELRPPLFFRDKPLFAAQVRQWSHKRLGQALELVNDAEAESKGGNVAAEVIAARTCLRLAAAVTPRRH